MAGPDDSGGSKSPVTPRARVSDGNELAVAERPTARVARDIGSAAWPQLTRTNYTDWAVLMQVMMEGRFLWDAVQTGTAERSDDRLALEAILRGVPPEMGPTLAGKATAKDAWDTTKTMRLGGARVREAKLLGEVVPEKRVVRKFLSVVPKRYSQIALSIETLVDLDNLSVEELTGRLKAAEERYDLEQAEASVGRLLLTEEEWAARLKGRGGSSSNAPRGGGHRGRGRGSGRGGRGNGKADDDRCRYCGIAGHWARDSRKKKREEANQANLTQAEVADDEDPTFLMAQVCTITDAGDISDDYVDLVEEYAEVHLGRTEEEYDSKWYLDTGASNHMSGSAACFNELDRRVGGTVKFGDGSVVAICGRGSVLFTDCNGGHRVLTGVYFIPRLRSSIVSVGQLDEGGCKTVITGGVFTLSDRR
ncbi:uncharacterized protein [Aegilops tauschii subsp. strangulata]|uniref:uncharacterized protein n=1 Tax=Aegilops tauschii subsp. strangulata TaxID=200361 RepID=UPI003CC88F72